MLQGLCLYEWRTGYRICNTDTRNKFENCCSLTECMYTLSPMYMKWEMIAFGEDNVQDRAFHCSFLFESIVLEVEHCKVKNKRTISGMVFTLSMHGRSKVRADGKKTPPSPHSIFNIACGIHWERFYVPPMKKTFFFYLESEHLVMYV